MTGHPRRSVVPAVLAVVALLCVGLLPTAVSAARPAEVAGSQPDIVVVMLDDVAADAMPALLKRLPTMRSMFLEHGVRFRNAFGQDPLCCPGRAGFLTGLTSRHHGVNTNDASLLDPGMTIATALQDAGYHTIVAGKYLNGVAGLTDRTPPGWNRVAISSGGYLPWVLYRQGKQIVHRDDPAGYSTDVFANESVAWLGAAPQDRPRFALLTPFATHGDSAWGTRLPQPATRHRGDPRCKGTGFRRTPAWDEADVADRARWVQSRPALSTQGVDPRGWPLVRACEALLSVDEWLARVVDVQQQQNRLDRTLFVLTADNGMSWGDHRHLGKSVPWATPIPLYLSWPGVLGTQPAVNRAFVMNIDLAPTFAELGGATLGPYPTGQTRPDGASLVPTILAGAATNLPRTSLFEEHREERHPKMAWSALRTTNTHPCGRWHYTEWADGDRELFDVGQDKWELVNVAAANPGIVAQLSAELALRADGSQADASVCLP